MTEKKHWRYRLAGGFLAGSLISIAVIQSSTVIMNAKPFLYHMDKQFQFLERFISNLYWLLSSLLYFSNVRCSRSYIMHVHAVSFFPCVHELLGKLRNNS